MKPDSLQTEIDAAYLYQQLADHETDASLKKVYAEMSAIERGHAHKAAQRDKITLTDTLTPSWRARTINSIGKLFGYGYVLGALMDTEKSISNGILFHKRRNNQPVTGAETNHVKILRTILEEQKAITGPQISKFESRHRSVGGNAIRAAVLGGNDGLISNFSLVMGIAGASDSQAGVLLAGVAGLLAGSLSMAMGEWISVKSSQELYENQMQLEMEELETDPEGERQELALIFMAKGIPEDQAKRMALEATSDKQRAHDVLVKEELGIDAEELKGSAMQAAVFSFVLFAVGAIIPVIPFMFASGLQAIMLSATFSACGLFIIGAAITLFTGRNVWYSGFRQVLFGIAAAAITFGIGKLVGVSMT